MEAIDPINSPEGEATAAATVEPSARDLNPGSTVAKSTAVVSKCRGELTLTPEEAEKINQLLSQENYRFLVYTPPPESSKMWRKPADYESIHTLSDRGGASGSFESRRSKSQFSLKSGDSREDDARTVSSIDNAEKRSLRKRKQRVRYYDEFVPDFTESNYQEISHEKSHKSQKDAPRKQQSGSYERQPAQQLYRAVPILSRNLPKLPKDTWEYTAYRTLQAIKYMDNDKWFWYPVDPVADGVPDYPKVVHTPMDFHTIIERLHMRQYSNPFAFQCDCRQIFFNAFLFYQPNNVIWQAAEHLAKALEEKLQSTRYLHPDEFHTLLQKGEDAMRATLLEYNQTTFLRKAKWNAASLGLDYAEAMKPLEKRKAAQNHRSKDIIDEYMYAIDDDDDSFNELSSVASADDFALPVNAGRSRPKKTKSKVPYWKKYNVNPKNKFDNLSEESDSGSRLKFEGEFPVPDVGRVLPPPPPVPSMHKASPLEKGITLIQTRTLNVNLSRLAPNQRKAALELIEDDLGIVGETFMYDRTFTFDPSLLPVDKQRRVFIYVSAMVKRNLEDMQATFTRKKKPKPQKDVPVHDANEISRPNPSEIFDASSSSSSISDVASNFLSSDDFFDSSDDEPVSANGKSEKPASNDAPLPEYTPVDEQKSEKVQLTRGIMGDHADFFTHVESPPLNEDGSQGQQGKKSAWMEWKGQAIHHGTVAQENGVEPLSVDEKIAESFDARI
ncbi:bromodomain-containing protein [Babesia ovata]|uniref:Bromodomain-containing protein n=1 Tax=Babesia ovata TaxID=189622 RepID=A0A2H6K9L2_9APIC|nr:bromodomain-containing protein [Babesia ovata]GBE59692.1 bromodomain-containing protein [Babesia ovata]